MIVIRYVLLPLVGLGVVKVAIHLGWVGSDKLYQFNLLIQFALPPATTLGTKSLFYSTQINPCNICSSSLWKLNVDAGTMTQLHGVGENECSVLMLWTYALAPVALTIWSTLYMWFVG